MSFASTSLGAEQLLLNSEMLGYGRDPLGPIKDAVTADGDVGVPLGAEAFGFWLKAAFGLFPALGIMQIDLGAARRWGEPSPSRPVPFAAVSLPARESLAQSPTITIQGGGAAGVATLGAAGVDVA